MFRHIQRIEINPTELCNLKCSFCPRSKGYKNSNDHIHIDTATEIKRQLDSIGYTKYVSITGRGEPTLTRDFNKILDIMLEDAQYKAYMHTNGHKLDMYLDYIDLFWRVYLNVYDPDPNIYDDMVEKYAKYANIKVTHKPDCYTTYTKFNQQTGHRFSNRAGCIESNSSESCNHPCAFLFQKMFINWNGDYHLCCDDWSNSKVLSNIFDQSIEYYITNNKELSMYRREHLTGGRHSLDICKNCTRDYKLQPNTLNKIKNEL